MMMRRERRGLGDFDELAFAGGETVDEGAGIVLEANSAEMGAG